MLHVRRIFVVVVAVKQVTINHSTKWLSVVLFFCLYVNRYSYNFKWKIKWQKVERKREKKIRYFCFERRKKNVHWSIFLSSLNWRTAHKTYITNSFIELVKEWKKRRTKKKNTSIESEYTVRACVCSLTRQKKWLFFDVFFLCFLFFTWILPHQ